MHVNMLCDLKKKKNMILARF